jgi:MinD superfamily P-loop ATPase
MREIVVLSGKGGTGKTSITASLAFIAGKKAVIADCDVDAADLHLILQPEIKKQEDFYSGFKAIIDQSICVKCGKCADVCRFDAIKFIKSEYSVHSFSCEGCGYCSYICPVQAIKLEEANVGHFFLSETRNQSVLAHAALSAGADNSGKLVAKVKKEAKIAAEGLAREFILVDGSPGIGCPVISSLSGSDFALFVTEPTLSGLHDLQRVYELSKKFLTEFGCIINKADINPTVAMQIEDFLKINKIQHLYSFVYDDDFHKAITLGKSLVEFNPHKWEIPFEMIWEKIIQKKET